MTADPVTWSSTTTRFVALLDNYDPVLKVGEELLYGEKTEIDGFLDVILTTDVCRYLQDFLIRKGILISKWVSAVIR